MLNMYALCVLVPAWSSQARPRMIPVFHELLLNERRAFRTAFRRPLPLPFIALRSIEAETEGNETQLCILKQNFAVAVFEESFYKRALWKAVVSATLSE